jgi:hypothetical protein
MRRLNAASPHPHKAFSHAHTHAHSLLAEEEEEEESSDSGVSFFSDTESVAAVKLQKKKAASDRAKAAERALQEAEAKKAKRRADLDSLSSLGLSFSSSELGGASPPERKK